METIDPKHLDLINKAFARLSDVIENVVGIRPQDSMHNEPLST